MNNGIGNHHDADYDRLLLLLQIRSAWAKSGVQVKLLLPMTGIGELGDIIGITPWPDECMGRSCLLAEQNILAKNVTLFTEVQIVTLFL